MTTQRRPQGALAGLGLSLPAPVSFRAEFSPVAIHGGYASDQQPVLADGASRLLKDVLGAAGEHARSAFGVAALPLGSPVELDAVAAVRT